MEVFIGTIIPWPINRAPSGWAFCQGQAMSIAQNQALFALLGTSFGGDGRSTFMLPDLRGRVILGAGQRPGSANYIFASTGGAEAITVTANNMPLHNHSMTGTVPFTLPNLTVKQPVSVASATVSNPKDAFPALGNVDGLGDTVNSYSSSATDSSYLAPAAVSGTSGDITLSGTTGAAGAGQPVASMPPYLAINYIISLYGLFPSFD